MEVHYLEIVTPDVEEVCNTYARLTGVGFGSPVEALGNARTASLSNGGRVGVRAPMHATETPAMRSYLLVDDVELAIQTAVAEGCEVAHPPFELPGEGKFAIYSQGGILHGIWERKKS